MGEKAAMPICSPMQHSAPRGLNSHRASGRAFGRKNGGSPVLSGHGVQAQDGKNIPSPRYRTSASSGIYGSVGQRYRLPIRGHLVTEPHPGLPTIGREG